MNVLMILSDHDFPPDIRVKKETKTLIEKGYNVFLVCPNYKNRSEKENINGINVFRIPYLFKNTRVLWLFSSFFLIRYIFLPYKILTICYNYKIDMFHIHDLPLAFPSIILAKILGKKTIFDMHENYPEMMKISLKLQKNIVFKYISELQISWYRLEEFLSIKLTDKIICVVEEQKEFVIKKGANSRKIVVVSNVVDTERIDKLKLFPEKKKLKDKFLITYVGGFSLHRGLDTLINALPSILKEIPNAHILLVGDSAIKEKLINLSKELNIEKNITFTGWLPFNKAMGCVIGSDVCAIPHDSTPHTENTIPHKLFQYMYLEKPVLVSDVAPFKRIINETKAGLIFRTEDKKDLTEKITWMHDHPEDIKEMGKNGRKAVLKRYNWNIEGKKLVRLYNSLFNKLC